jgi:hypothetical protein
VVYGSALRGLARLGWLGPAVPGSARVHSPRLGSAWLRAAQPSSTQHSLARLDLAGAGLSWLGSARLGLGIGLGGLILAKLGSA